ncbi:Ubiquitin conjugation factor E4 [Coemansia sp. RSA 1822]|nr:Ubiquitin conjugation factor E4 [Coemansia sp. RSA 1853]KAJ2565408.1 Ubiquitin conjugation factor E4 [Coemansia sp. RSA 1822]
MTLVARKVNTNPKRSTRCYLKGVADELRSEGIAVLITTQVFERVLVARLDEDMVAASGISVFEYLVGSWQMSQTVVSNLRGAKGKALDLAVREARVKALGEAQLLLVSYMGLSLQIPDMFPQLGRSGRAIMADALLADPNANPLAEQLPELLSQMAARFANDGLPEVIAPVISELGLRSLQRANRSLLQPGFRSILAALDTLTTNRQIAAAIPHMATFDPEDCNGRRMQTGTALGPFLALSGFPAGDESIAKVYYSDAPQRSHQDRESLHTSLRTTVQFLQSALFEIVNRLIRSGPGERTLTLQLTLRMLATNALRSGMQVDFTKVVDDGFADNLASVWMRLSEPFTNDASLSRLSRVDPDWVTLRALRSVRDGGLDDDQNHISTYWRELTRIDADKEQIDAYLEQQLRDQMPSDGGFIPDCFFVTAVALHLGFVSTIARYIEMMKRIGRFKSEIERVTNSPGMLTPAQRANLPVVMQRWESQLQDMKREKYAMDAQMLDPRRLICAMVFYRFVICFLLRQVDGQGAFPQQAFTMPPESGEKAGEKWRMLPEFLVEDAIEFVVFVTTYAPDVLTDSTAQVGQGGNGLRMFDDVLPLLVVTFLARPKLIRNPYLKAKLVDILHFLTYRDPREDDDYVDTLGGNIPGNIRLHPSIQQFQANLDSNALARAYLVPALLRFYVDIEQTGSSSQFFEKFTTRYYIARSLRALWARAPRYVEVTRRFFMQSGLGTSEATTTGSTRRDQRVIEEFVTRLMTDTTYLLDESLSKLAVIRDIEKKPAEAAGDNDDASRLEDAERMARSFVSLAHETVHMLAFLSRLVPRPFQASEIVSRLAAMLNYNLQQLAGPKCSNLKVQDMQKYSFNPRVLLSELTSVYVHLGLRTSKQSAAALSEETEAIDRFVMAVAEDDRSYSQALFDKAYFILEQRSLKSTQSLARLREFAHKCQSAKVDSRAMLFLESEAPDNYLDPLLASLMTNPVRLPTSDNIMELSAIKGQLLSDPRDPFNRAPLSVDMLEPLPELKREIAEWRERKLAEYQSRQ